MLKHVEIERVKNYEPQLYERVCPSVSPLVHPSVGPSVTSFFGGQKQRPQTTYAVYLACFQSLLDVRCFI